MPEIRFARAQDLPQLTAIYNEQVMNGTATFDIRPVSVESRRRWLAQHTENHPLLVAEDENTVAGYASLSAFSDKDAYAATAELSVYVHPAYRRKGIGRALMAAILDIARADPRTHAVISRITADNGPSLRLHEAFGFEQAGLLREVGEKFGRRLDVIYMELIVS